MAEGWKHVVADLRAALGLPAVADRPENGTPAAGAPSAAVDADLPEQATRDGISRPRPEAAGATETVPGEGLPEFPMQRETPRPVETGVGEADAVSDDATRREPVEGETLAPEPASPLQKLYSYAGLVAAIFAAVGIGWYVYFGQPRPPAPDVVATFNSGQITVQQVREHLALLTQGMEAIYPASYEAYRATVGHMVLNELVRRWAAEQKLDASAKFADAMRHVTESLTLDEWVTKLHESDMQSAVRESDIQAYYNANRASFGDATLSEVREQIQETLAHQNQEQFFEDYVARLREMATIERFDEWLDVTAPTDSEIQAYYQANREQFTQPQRAVVDVIYVQPQTPDEAGDTTARAKAEEALVALNTGRSVTDVIAQYSARPYAPQGVVIQAGGEDPALVEQAFALSGEGDLSPVFRTQAGYYLLRLREQQPARTLGVDEVSDQIAATLRVEKEGAWFEEKANQTLFTIHGERYTLGQFYHEYQNLPAELQAQFAGPQGMRELASLLIDRLLVLDDAYNKLLDRQNAPLLEEMRLVVLREMMHEAEVDRQVAVSDDAVRAYYNEHKELFVAAPEARIRTIRLYLGQTEDDRKRAWERAEAAYQALAPGLGSDPSDFEAVAQEYDESERDPADPGLGEWVRMGDDVLRNLDAHPLHSYLLNLSVGTVSPPFEFGDSVYLVKILERTEPVPLPFDQVQDFIRAELEAREHERLDGEVAARLMQQAKVMIYDEVLLRMVEADQATQTAQ